MTQTCEIKKKIKRKITFGTSYANATFGKQGITQAAPSKKKILNAIHHRHK